jgi:hypothetical protein
MARKKFCGADRLASVKMKGETLVKTGIQFVAVRFVEVWTT